MILSGLSLIVYVRRDLGIQYADRCVRRIGEVLLAFVPGEITYTFTFVQEKAAIFHSARENKPSE